MYLIERGRGATIKALTLLDPGMQYNATQPEQFKLVASILQNAARTRVTELQTIEHKIKRLYHDLGEMPGVGSTDRVLADKLRDLAVGCKIVYVQSRNNGEDLLLRRQFLMFGVTGGKRNGLYVEFAFVFMPHDSVAPKPYKVVCDRSNNSDADIDAGILTVDIEVMPNSASHAKQLEDLGWTSGKE